MRVPHQGACNDAGEGKNSLFEETYPSVRARTWDMLDGILTHWGVTPNLPDAQGSHKPHPLVMQQSLGITGRQSHHGAPMSTRKACKGSICCSTICSDPLLYRCSQTRILLLDPIPAISASLSPCWLQRNLNVHITMNKQGDPCMAQNSSGEESVSAGAHGCGEITG